MNVRKLFTEHEDHLTADMPTLVAVGYVNARRRAGRGERADKRLSVTGIDTVVEVPAWSGFSFGGGLLNIVGGPW